MKQLFRLPIDLSKRVYGLDLMRCWAILLVLLAHSRVLLQPAGIQMPWLKVGGYYGVELFFVLSGFLIGNILIKTLERWQGMRFGTLRDFWIRRWLRTLPNYLLILLLNILIYRFFTHNHNWSWKYFVFLQNFADRHPSFFDEAWSLAVEEWFYLLFPFALFALNRLRPAFSLQKLFFYTCLAFLVLPLLFRIAYAWDGVPYWDADIRKVVVFRLDAIMYGVMAAYLAYYQPAFWRRIRRPALVVALVLILLSTVFYFMDVQGALPPTFWAKTFLFSLVSLGFASLLPAASLYERALRPIHKFVTVISLISYSIYLIHYSLVLKILQRLFPFTDLAPALALYLVYWGITLLLSFFLFKYFEQPTTRLRNRLVHKERRVTVSAPEQSSH